MLRVGQVIESIDAQSGGTSSALVEITAALARDPARASLNVYTPEPPEGDAIAKRLRALDNVAWRPTGPVGGLRPGGVARAAITDIQLGKLDVVQLHGLWSMDLVATARACARAGVPCCWTPHGMLLDEALSQKRLKKSVFMALGLARELRRAGALLFATDGERDGSHPPRGTPRDRLHTVGLPVEFIIDEPRLATLATEGRAKFGVPSDAELVVFIGRVHPVKRLELTIEALAVAAATRPRAALLILGAGDDDYVASLREVARRLGVEQRVFFGGWVSGDDKWRGLACADVAVVNSLHENFGYGIVESLGAGVPVVVTDNLSMAAEVRAASVGALSPPEPKALGAALAAALADPSRRSRGKAGRRWALGRFSSDRFGARLLDLFERLAPR